MDIVKRLREGRNNGTDLRWIVTEVHLEAAAEIERLRAELAGRDAEIAAWLRERGDQALPREAEALYDAATAIASGEYRKGEG